jgi:hypothetical protein
VSFIVPGQGKKNEEVIGTRAGAKPLTPESTALAPVEEPPAVEFAGWPPELQKLVEDDFRRTGALAGYRWKTADAALVDVVRGLDDLLDLTADRIQDTEPQRSGRQTRKASPPTADVSFDEVADLLGIPADELNGAIDAAGRPVRRSRADRRTAQRAIKQLRIQLQQVEVTMDHTRLTPLTGFIVRVVLALGTVVGSQSASELFAGDEHLDTLIPPAVGALAAFALERKTAALADAWNEHNPAALAAQTRKDLLRSLSEAKPTDDTAATFGLLVHSARAWVACFQLDWPATDKLQYWQALDDLPDAIRDDSLQALRDRLEALAPPR